MLHPGITGVSHQPRIDSTASRPERSNRENVADKTLITIRNLATDFVVGGGATLVALLLLEGVVATAITAKPAIAPGNLAEYKPYHDTPPFRDAPWKRQHARDIARVGHGLQLLLHVPHPIAAEPVNVDARGHRRSCRAAESPVSEDGSSTEGRFGVLA